MAIALTHSELRCHRRAGAAPAPRRRCRVARL